MVTITIESFTKLIAWQKAHRLVLAIYSTTKEFPKVAKDVGYITTSKFHELADITIN